ncbi:MAG: transcription regulator gal80 [Chrysothrix sp. TS-e1954]|nr:MAG: transcription regulator gal80 [Chrysothrix sp. TS-e1954]
MAPIRIGILGLSKSGGWAVTAHLPYLKDTSKYTIAAVCNTSIASAEEAIKHFELGNGTKPYGSAQELAADPDVDLIVCSVRVDRHYDAIKPAIEAGKQCFVEWPLGANLKQAEELNGLAHAKGIKTMVGLQGRHNPLFNKLKELLAANRIGKVLSSTMTIAAGFWGSTTPVDAQYMNDAKVGGNLLTIFCGHMLDFVFDILGDLKSYDGQLATQRPEVDIIGANGELIGKGSRDSPDQVLLQGVFKSGAVFSYHMRGGATFKGTPGFRWNIYGEKGEIEITSTSPLITFNPDDQQIRVHDHAKDEVEVVDWRTEDAAGKLPGAAQNVARHYEAYAAGRKQQYVDWDEAVERHKFIDSMGKGPISIGT